MERVKKFVLLAITALLPFCLVQAQQFTVDYPFTASDGTAYTYSLTYRVEADQTLAVVASNIPSPIWTGSEYLPLPCNVVIPSEVEYGGQFYTVTAIADGSSASSGVFAYQLGLTSVVVPNTVTKIGMAAFWSCENMEEIVLGNSVAEIGDMAFQYCHKLRSISLPNSLQRVGSHFLCCCCGLETLVIPENLTQIGEYFLHGCESLKAVYLLGDNPRELGSYPFMSQDQQGKQQVHDCTFYVDSQDVYEQLYKNGENWKYADEDNSDYLSDDGHYQNGGNRYEWALPDDIRPYEGHWVTVCFPEDVDAAAVFGDECLLAQLSGARYVGIDNEVNIGNYHYQLQFNLVADKQLKANTPYLLKVDPKNVGSAFIVPHIDGEELIADDELSVAVDISNQADDPSASLTTICMLGTFQPDGHNLLPGEFLFSNTTGDDTQMKFFGQREGGVQRHVARYRCYWQIWKDHERVTNCKVGVNFTTGVEAVAPCNGCSPRQTYDLMGRRVVAPRPGTKQIILIDGRKYLLW